MTVQYKNRVRGTSTTTGTGTYTVLAAPTGFQGFSTLTSGRQLYYCAVLDAGWEVGIGTLTISGSTTVSRDKILESSNSGAAVNWPAGTKAIFLVDPAEVIQAITYEDGGGGVYQNNLNLSGLAYIAKSLTVKLGLNVAGGVAGTNTITGSLSPSLTTYAAGTSYTFIPANDNTGAVTLDLDGLGATSVVKANGTALVAGDLKVGIPAHVLYDFAHTRFVLLNPNAPLPLALGGTGGADAASARTALGLGSLAVLNSVNDANWSGTALAVANGGTGSTSAPAALTALGAAAVSHGHSGADITSGTVAAARLPATTAYTDSANKFLGTQVVKPVAETGYAIWQISNTVDQRKLELGYAGGSSAGAYGAAAGEVFINVSNTSLVIATGDTERIRITVAGVITLNGVNITDYMQKSQNLADVANVATARSSLGIKSMALRDVTIQNGGAPSGGADGDFFFIW